MLPAALYSLRILYEQIRIEQHNGQNCMLYNIKCVTAEERLNKYECFAQI